jgi:hypothetical protein
MRAREYFQMANSGLATLDAQLDGIAAALREIDTRIKAAKLTAQAAEAALVRQPVEPARREHDPKDNPDRIVSIAEASALSSLSIDTLRRQHRGKFVQLSERRFGMRLCDALMLRG